MPPARRITRLWMWIAAVACVMGGAYGVHRVRGYMGNLAVLDAIRRDDPAALDAAFTAGGSVSARNARGWSVLMEAASDRAVGVMPELLARGADVNARDAQGWTPLMNAVLHSQSDIAQALLCHGASVDAANSDGETPLMLAARAGSRSLVRLLLDHGADPSLRDAHGETAGVEARSKGYPDLAVLLERGRLRAGRTPGRCYVCLNGL